VPILINIQRAIATMLAAVLVLLLGSVAGSSALAQVMPSDRDMVAAAGQPHAYVISTNSVYANVHHTDFLWSIGGRATAAARARNYIHNFTSSDSCWRSKELCTIQIFNGDRYRVYHFHTSGSCTVFGLDNFSGLWDTHNWDTRMAIWLDQGGKEIGWYAPYRHDAVNWTPVWRIRIC
jgi:hypothetical protein